jgi:hypothetical protein
MYISTPVGVIAALDPATRVERWGDQARGDTQRG